MKKYQKAFIRFMLILLCAGAVFLYFTVENGKALDARVNDPGGLFHGAYTTESGFTEQINPLQGYNLCVSLSAENIGYDPRHLKFGDKDDAAENFNSYYIRRAKDVSFNEEGQEETTWHLCDYDGINSVILLDEDNEEIGRITYEITAENWLGKRSVNYYWIHDGKATQIYRRADMTYNGGQAYLKSRYYTGKFD